MFYNIHKRCLGVFTRVHFSNILRYFGQENSGENHQPRSRTDRKKKKKLNAITYVASDLHISWSDNAYSDGVFCTAHIIWIFVKHKR